MQVKTLLKELENLPPDYEIVLTKVVALNAAKKVNAVISFPTCGLFSSHEDKEVRLCIKPQVNDKEIEDLFGEFILDIR